MTQLTVKYLASLAEDLGKPSDTFILGDDLHACELTVAVIWAALNPKRELSSHIVCAVNFAYATPETVVVDGDEIAFFPPVTGG